MSGSINLEPQNDAPTAEIAGNNCAYCAVGGLFGVSANAIMKDVFRKTGKKDDDGDRAPTRGVGAKLLSSVGCVFRLPWRAG
jgi:hypothetical protein